MTINMWTGIEVEHIDPLRGEHRIISDKKCSLIISADQRAVKKE